MVVFEVFIYNMLLACQVMNLYKYAQSKKRYGNNFQVNSKDYDSYGHISQKLSFVFLLISHFWAPDSSFD